MNDKEKLEIFFKEFPGVGPRQAKRFVHSLLFKKNSELLSMAKLISEIKIGTKKCTECSRFFQNKEEKIKICNVCSDSLRDKSKLLILEKTPDFDNIHSSGLWNGQYFLIGRNLKLTEQNPDIFFNLEPIFKKINSGILKEITFALSLNPEGEITKNYIESKIIDIINEKKLDIKITELGRGLSLGSEIEYSDPITLSAALKNRK